MALRHMFQENEVLEELINDGRALFRDVRNRSRLAWTEIRRTNSILYLFTSWLSAQRRASKNNNKNTYKQEIGQIKFIYFQ
jgi:hypothetical protein